LVDGQFPFASSSVLWNIPRVFIESAVFAESALALGLRQIDFAGRVGGREIVEPELGEALLGEAQDFSAVTEKAV
jgi:hypothetical protein